MTSLKWKVSLTASILEVRELAELGRLSEKDLDFYLWWNNLAEKFLFLGVWTWWQTWPHIKIGKLGQIP